jgi:hypothetical protein
LLVFLFVVLLLLGQCKLWWGEVDRVLVHIHTFAKKTRNTHIYIHSHPHTAVTRVADSIDGCDEGFTDVIVKSHMCLMYGTLISELFEPSFNNILYLGKMGNATITKVRMRFFFPLFLTPLLLLPCLYPPLLSSFLFSSSRLRLLFSPLHSSSTTSYLLLSYCHCIDSA